MRWVFLSCALALLSACGRSWIFDAFEETSSSTSGGRTTGGSGSSGGRTSASGTGGTGTSGSGASSGGTGCLGAGAFCDPGRCCPGLVCAALEDQGICRAAGTSSGGNASTGSAASGTGTSGGSTGTSTGTSGGTTGGCQQGGAPNELSPCQGDSDCACPLACVPGPGGERLCEYPCQTTADCPALYTICQGGSCQPNLCGGEFDNGTLDGPCNVLGTND
ncbi:MAG TPA: hypothetical protein VMB50_02240, partial [Myxococcales bacterium]|nr:hypothetical protein [Myxococcales bacterium]